MIRVKPIKDKKELALEFPIPLDYYKFYESKPEKILGSIIGHEGKGSLLSFLKEKGLATGLGAHGAPDTPDYGSLGIYITLTEKGVEQYQTVLEYCFSYFEMLKKEGFKDYLFERRRLEGGAAEHRLRQGQENDGVHDAVLQQVGVENPQASNDGIGDARADLRCQWPVSRLH